MVAFHDWQYDRQIGACEICHDKKATRQHDPRPQCDRCVVGVHGCTGVACFCECMKKHSHGRGTGWKNKFKEWVPFTDTWGL